jgi:predicted  nucleic acid-binding Zn-ribbon protein
MFLRCSQVANLTDKNKLLEQESRSKLDTTAKQVRDQVDAANAKVEAAQKEKRALEDRIAQLESALG